MHLIRAMENGKPGLGKGNVLFHVKQTKNVTVGSIQKNKMTWRLDLKIKILGYKILNNNEEKDYISVDNSRYIGFNILNKNNDNSENIRLKLAFEFSLRDGLWMDVTWLGELYFEKELTTTCNVKKPE